jgi:hypothetical protein
MNFCYEGSQTSNKKKSFVFFGSDVNAEIHLTLITDDVKNQLERLPPANFISD